MVMVGVRLSQDQKDYLQRLAVNQHKTGNDIVRKLVPHMHEGDITLLC